MNERATRKQLIDRAPANAGWRVVSYALWVKGDRTAADAVDEFPIDSGPGDVQESVGKFFHFGPIGKDHRT